MGFSEATAVPMGVPVANATVVIDSKTAINRPNAEEKAEILRKHGMPAGLAKEMIKNVDAFPRRIWIVDDSYSMQEGDGSLLVEHKMIKCSRGKELAQTVLLQAELAAALGAKIDFQTLNGPSHTIDAADPSAQLAVVREYYDRRGGHALLGGTPLTEAVHKVIGKVEPMAASLRASGQRVVVVIATDGHPNNAQTFLSAMKQLQELPVLVFVRLCTNEDGVANYWNEIDKDLERPLDVLDDVAGEAEECARVNPWLKYAAPLQAAREFGMSHKLFDLLDEKPLIPTQAAELLELLFGVRLPEPEVDFTAFRNEVRMLCEEAGDVFYPPTRSTTPWVDLKKLHAALAPRVPLRLQLSGERLKKMDFFSESDPFVVVSDTATCEKLYTSEHYDNEPNPSWREFELSVFVDIEARTTLWLQVFDRNTFTDAKLIGAVRVGADELLHGKAQRLELLKDGKGGRGFLVVNRCERL